MDPEDRHLRGNSSFMYRQLFFTCVFHGPPSGIQVSLTHSHSCSRPFYSWPGFKGFFMFHDENACRDIPPPSWESILFKAGWQVGPTGGNAIPKLNREGAREQTKQSCPELDRLGRLLLVCGPVITGRGKNYFDFDFANKLRLHVRKQPKACPSERWLRHSFGSSRWTAFLTHAGVRSCVQVERNVCETILIWCCKLSMCLPSSSVTKSWSCESDSPHVCDAWLQYDISLRWIFCYKA